MGGKAEVVSVQFNNNSPSQDDEIIKKKSIKNNYYTSNNTSMPLKDEKLQNSEYQRADSLLKKDLNLNNNHISIKNGHWVFETSTCLWISMKDKNNKVIPSVKLQGLLALKALQVSIIWFQNMVIIKLLTRTSKIISI